MNPNTSRPKRRLPIFRILIFLLALGVLAFAALQLMDFYSEDKKSDQAAQILREQAVTAIPIPSLPEEETTPDNREELPLEPLPTYPAISYTIPISVDFSLLQAENPDIIGWIYCADTPINYPIVQALDNQYYVDRLVDGTPNGAGAIFMDFRNNPDFSDLNTIIYGHNMTNKSMFGSLRDYRNQSYYDQFPSLWIVTPETAYRVDLVAGCVTAADSDDYDLLDQKEDLQALLKELMGRSTFESNVNPNVVNNVVVLSTCTYEYDNARYIVVGSLLPIPYPDEFTEASSGNDLTK